jgi:hypothetical protein
MSYRHSSRLLVRRIVRLHVVPSARGRGNLEQQMIPRKVLFSCCFAVSVVRLKAPQAIAGVEMEHYRHVYTNKQDAMNFSMPNAGMECTRPQPRIDLGRYIRCVEHTE